MSRRDTAQGIVDFISFPIRAFALFYEDRWGLSSLASERFRYVAQEVQGYCLDVGCGKNNRFVTEYLAGRGKGIDLYPYEGLSAENIVDDLTRFPFENSTFDSVTFIANINYVPKTQRDAELGEAHRVLKSGGNVIITMGHPWAETVVHKVVRLYDTLLKTRYNVEFQRGMDIKEEEYYLTDVEITERLARAGFKKMRKKYFWTQWGLNHLFVGWKD